MFKWSIGWWAYQVMLRIIYYLLSTVNLNLRPEIKLIRTAIKYQQPISISDTFPPPAESEDHSTL